MKISLLALVFLIGVPIVASARIGETKEQLVTRYGKGMDGGYSGSHAGAKMVMRFEKSGFSIMVYLVNDVSGCEQISKSSGDSLTDDEIKTLLSDNAQDHHWKEVKTRSWERDDGAMAKVDSNGFLVESKELIDADAAAFKAAHASSLDGF